MKLFLKKNGLYFAWLIALVGVVTSLYFGEGLGIKPCTLCWYQRILLYPLVIILGIATYRDDRKVYRYAMPLIVIGGIIALYQVLYQELPGFHPLEVCGSDNDCSKPKYKFFGFVTIPLMSLAAFVIMGISLHMTKPAKLTHKLNKNNKGNKK